MNKRIFIPLIVIASTLLMIGFIQPVLVSAYTSPNRIVEQIPINTAEAWTMENSEMTIDIEGVALVKANGDAFFQIRYSYRSRSLGDAEWIEESDDFGFYVSKFAEYRQYVLEFAEGRRSEPYPIASENAVKGNYGTFSYYYWYNFKFVRVPGSPQQWVKYDHADNYYTYYKEQWNVDWNMYKYHSSGWGKQVYHLSQYTMGVSIGQASLFYMAAALAAGIAGLFAIYFPIALIIAAIAAFLVGIGVVISWFLTSIVLSEQNDGWQYTHFNHVNRDVLISFGAWRDLGIWIGKF